MSKGDVYRKGVAMAQAHADASLYGGGGAGFDRCNLSQLAMQLVQAHGGTGAIRFCRVASREGLAGACNFIDVELAAGSSVGRHRHREIQEEFYLVLSGEGRRWRDGEVLTIRGGDLIRNRPGGEHGLENPGPEPLRLFVFELEVQ
jgi:mannose-6-phosphate isomerase-like protein (cupin superfamily)